VQVRLARSWVDGAGVSHGRGDVVDIDAVTLAQLEEAGIVTDPNKDQAGWIGPGGATDGTDPAWIGPGGSTEGQTTTTDPATGGTTAEAGWIGPGGATDGDSGTTSV
jgi:hypothetical protein